MEWHFIYFPLFCFLLLREIKVYFLLQKKKKATGSDGLCICTDLQHKSEQRGGVGSFISQYFVKTLTALLLETVKSQKLKNKKKIWKGSLSETRTVRLLLVELLEVWGSGRKVKKKKTISNTNVNIWLGIITHLLSELRNSPELLHAAGSLSLLQRH